MSPLRRGAHTTTKRARHDPSTKNEGCIFAVNATCLTSLQTPFEVLAMTVRRGQSRARDRR
jgi:hypothetical protein